MTPELLHKRMDLYKRVYEKFNAPVSRFDCGRKCAPHNDGEPVCCSTKHAIPIADKAEFELLKRRSDLWFEFVPKDAADRRELSDLHDDCMAIECKGFKSCERDNRTMACRAFPFFPYMDKQGEILGLSHYWYFEDRCWVISHYEIVTPDFVRECLEACEMTFAEDQEEYDVNKRLSADMRRVFARWNRPIPLIHRKGGFYLIEPRTHEMRACTPDEFERHGPYKDDKTVQASEPGPL